MARAATYLVVSRTVPYRALVVRRVQRHRLQRVHARRDYLCHQLPGPRRSRVGERRHVAPLLGVGYHLVAEEIPVLHGRARPDADRVRVDYRWGRAVPWSSVACRPAPEAGAYSGDAHGHHVVEVVPAVYAVRGVAVAVGYEVALIPRLVHSVRTERREQPCVDRATGERYAYQLGVGRHASQLTSHGAPHRERRRGGHRTVAVPDDLSHERNYVTHLGRVRRVPEPVRSGVDVLSVGYPVHHPAGVVSEAVTRVPAGRVYRTGRRVVAVEVRYLVALGARLVVGEVEVSHDVDIDRVVDTRLVGIDHEHSYRAAHEGRQDRVWMVSHVIHPAQAPDRVAVGIHQALDAVLGPVEP